MVDEGVDAVPHGDRLSDDEIISFLFLMVVAGNETTTKLLANAWYWAWRFPDQKAKALGDPGRAPQWVEETLRYDTSSQMLLRVTTGEVELLGTVLGDGERVLLLVGSANRDAEVFEDPDRYDLDRDTSKLISFGGGRHFCLGAPLARLEARVDARGARGPGGRLRHRRRAGPPGPLHQRAGLRQPPHHRHGALREDLVPCPGPDSSPTPHAEDRWWPGRPRASAPPPPRPWPQRDTRWCSAPAGSSSAKRWRRGIRAAGGEAHVHRLDLAEAASVEEFAAAAFDAVGPVDIMVSSAGHAEPGTALGTSPKDFAHTVEVNLLGAHRLVAAFAPAMAQRHHGDLVFVSSDILRLPRPLMAAYMASKWGLEGLVRALQLELEGTGVRATIVQPGQTLTEMGTDWGPDTTAEALERVGPLRGGPPQPLPAAPRRRRRRARGGVDPARDPPPHDRGPARGSRPHRRGPIGPRTGP